MSLVSSKLRLMKVLFVPSLNVGGVIGLRPSPSFLLLFATSEQEVMICVLRRSDVETPYTSLVSTCQSPCSPAPKAYPALWSV